MFSRSKIISPLRNDSSADHSLLQLGYLSETDRAIRLSARVWCHYVIQLFFFPPMWRQKADALSLSSFVRSNMADCDPFAFIAAPKSPGFHYIYDCNSLTVLLLFFSDTKLHHFVSLSKSLLLFHMGCVLHHCSARKMSRLIELSKFRWSKKHRNDPSFNIKKFISSGIRAGF